MQNINKYQRKVLAEKYIYKYLLPQSELIRLFNARYFKTGTLRINGNREVCVCFGIGSALKNDYILIFHRGKDMDLYAIEFLTLNSPTPNTEFTLEVSHDKSKYKVISRRDNIYGEEIMDTIIKMLWDKK